MSIRSRIGIGFVPSRTTQAIYLIERAEAAGVETAWTVMPATGRDTLTLYAAAVMRTSRIKLGTAIVPAFTRHPLAMATQMLTLEDLAPGRYRLGIGTSHQRTMIPAFGTDFTAPLTHLKEYAEILRTVLHEGAIAHKGEYYTANTTLAYAPKTPVLISALRENAWEVAGEISDGGISWLCPIEYLAGVAKPALARGAAKSGRTAPPVIAHVLVSPSEDRGAVRNAARELLSMYAGAVYYQRMFAASGFELGPNLEIPEALIDALVVSGSAAEITTGLEKRLDQGMDELLLSLVPSGDGQADEDGLLRVISGLS